MSGFWTIVIAVLSFGTAITIGLFMGLKGGSRPTEPKQPEPTPESVPGSLSSGPLNLTCPDATCDCAPSGEEDADAAFASAMRMLNGAAADEAMDPLVERIVAIVQNAVVEAEAVELDECEAEFLADPMHFGRPAS